jgi:hypothetical protein
VWPPAALGGRRGGSMAQVLLETGEKEQVRDSGRVLYMFPVRATSDPHWRHWLVKIRQYPET